MRNWEEEIWKRRVEESDYLINQYGRYATEWKYEDEKKEKK